MMPAKPPANAGVAILRGDLNELEKALPNVQSMNLIRDTGAIAQGGMKQLNEGRLLPRTMPGRPQEIFEDETVPDNSKLIIALVGGVVLISIFGGG